ncbi:MAG: M14 family metallopeptidase [Bacteroidota bacterium]
MRIIALFFFICFSLSGFTQPSLLVSDFLGYEVGEQFTRHHQVVDYFKHVAQHSDKVIFKPYGKSYEGRDLVLVVVSSPENLAEIETIRTNNLKSTGYLEGEPEGKEKAIVWFSYNVHGDEAVNSEAALKTLEALATNSQNSDNWLEEVVVVIDPCLNPDGHDRYVNFYHETGNYPPNPSLDSREHYPPWPGGRSNHYLFDLNRDWAWQTQIESQQRISVYQEWMPHVHVDFHEMGINSPYFFAPAVRPFHEEITKWQYEFQEDIGHNNARYFDEYGWLYFTKEVFDLFYPSYGDTWPVFNGAIGFTYEQGGSRNAGLTVETETGDLLTLKDRVDHHFIAGIATIETSFDKRETLLKEFKNYYDQARNNPPGKYKTYVFKSKGQEGRIKRLLEVLDLNKISSNRVTRNGGSHRGYDYQARKNGSFQLEKGDVVVSTAQPAARLIKVLLEPEAMLEDSATYDLTAWSLPYAYDLDAYASEETLTANGDAHTAFAANTLTRKAAYAYISGWKDTGSAQFLSALLKAGIKVRFAYNGFNFDGTEHQRGSLIINRGDNTALGEDFDKTIIDIANSSEQEVSATYTGFASRGADLGSSNYTFISKPEVALISGPGVNVYAFGEIWHYFERVLEYPVTVVSRDDLTSIDLSKYSVVVLPSGGYSGEDVSKALTDFARNGGTLIAFERAMSAFANDKTNLGRAISSQKENGKKNNKKDADTPLPRFEDQTANYLSNSAPGCIYEVELDDSHPLAFGQDGTMYMLKRSSRIYPFMEGGWNVGRYRKDARVSGFIGHKLEARLENTIAFGTERMGRGNIVYFVDSPIFRGFWDSGNLVLANAIFFVGQ